MYEQEDVYKVDDMFESTANWDYNINGFNRNADILREVLYRLEAIEKSNNKNIIEITNNATNGEVFRILFPNLKLKVKADSNWWNAPYKKDDSNAE